MSATVLHKGNYDENGDGELSMDEFRYPSDREILLSVELPILLRVGEVRKNAVP